MSANASEVCLPNFLRVFVIHIFVLLTFTFIIVFSNYERDTYL